MRSSGGITGCPPLYREPAKTSADRATAGDLGDCL